MLRKLSEDFYVFEQSLRALGGELPIRTTVIRLQSGKLFVHSPGPLHPVLRCDIEGLGGPAFLVASERMHTAHLPAWLDAWPDALVFGTRGVATKRKDVVFNGILGDEAPPHWVGEIDQHLLTGVGGAAEVVFYHRATRTLLLSDLTGADEAVPFGTRMAGWWLARREGFPWPRLTCSELRRYRTAAKAHLRSILDWQFDRVVVAHGQMVEQGGRSFLEAAFG